MKYFIIAGEASGDLHASRLMSQLKIQDPNAQFAFLGGDLMQKQGGELIIHYRDMAFMGIINVAMNLKTIKQNIQICKDKIIQFNPDIVIFIDYPGFNLRIAKWIKETNLNIPTHYYIAPKLWAWKSYRIKSIRKYIDHMYTILPFETEYFRNKQYEVNYVGNPCVDAVLDFKASALTKEQFLQKYELEDKPIVALLAGSRKQEIKGCIKKMAQMAPLFPNHQFIISGAPSIDTSLYKSLINQDLKIISNDTYNLLNNATAAIVNSGTATLETALIGTPQVIVYHVFGGIFASLLKKILLHIKYVSLVNLIAEKEIVKELIAHKFTTKNLQKELDLILNNNAVINHIKAEYTILRSKLGTQNTAVQCAKAILKNKRE